MLDLGKKKAVGKLETGVEKSHIRMLSTASEMGTGLNGDWVKHLTDLTEREGPESLQAIFSRRSFTHVSAIIMCLSTVLRK